MPAVRPRPRTVGHEHELSLPLSFSFYRGLSHAPVLSAFAQECPLPYQWRKPRRPPADPSPAYRGMITATTGSEAIDGGVEILKAGGSAADAARGDCAYADLHGRGLVGELCRHHDDDVFRRCHWEGL